MSNEQFGLYVRCLNHAWINDGLPQNLVEITRLFCESSWKHRGFHKLWECVGRCFIEKSGRLVSPMQEAQRAQLAEHSELKRKAARHGWDARRDARALHVHDGVQCYSVSSSVSSSISIEEKNPPIVLPSEDLSQKPPPRKRSKPEIRTETREWFVGFWDASWKRGGKQKALAAADKHILTGDNRSEAMARMLHDRPEQLTHEEHYRKHLSTWINDGCWSDPIEAEPSQLALVPAGNGNGHYKNRWVENKEIEDRMFASFVADRIEKAQSGRK